MALLLFLLSCWTSPRSCPPGWMRGSKLARTAYPRGSRLIPLPRAGHAKTWVWESTVSVTPWSRVMLFLIDLGDRSGHRAQLPCRRRKTHSVAELPVRRRPRPTSRCCWTYRSASSRCCRLLVGAVVGAAIRIGSRRAVIEALPVLERCSDRRRLRSYRLAGARAGAPAPGRHAAVPGLVAEDELPWLSAVAEELLTLVAHEAWVSCRLPVWLVEVLPPVAVLVPACSPASPPSSQCPRPS